MPDKNNTAKKAGILTVASAQKAMPGLYPAAALGKMAASRVFSAEKDPNDPGRMTDEKMESLNDAIIELGPFLRMSIPMTLVSQHGPVHADWTRLEGALDEIYGLLTLGAAPHGGTPLGELLGRKNGDSS